MKKLVAIHLVDMGIVNGKPRVAAPKSQFTAPDQKTEEYLLRVGAAREYNAKTDGPAQPAAEQVANPPAQQSAAPNASDATIGTEGYGDLTKLTKAELVDVAEKAEVDVDAALNKADYLAALETALAAKASAQNEDLV